MILEEKRIDVEILKNKIKQLNELSKSTNNSYNKLNYKYWKLTDTIEDLEKLKEYVEIKYPQLLEENKKKWTKAGAISFIITSAWIIGYAILLNNLSLLLYAIPITTGINVAIPIIFYKSAKKELEQKHIKNNTVKSLDIKIETLTKELDFCWEKLITLLEKIRTLKDLINKYTEEIKKNSSIFVLVEYLQKHGLNEEKIQKIVDTFELNINNLLIDLAAEKDYENIGKEALAKYQQIKSATQYFGPQIVEPKPKIYVPKL